MAADPGLPDQFRAAAIQAFEFTYALAFKFMKRQLEQIVSALGQAGLLKGALDGGLYAGDAEAIGVISANRASRQERAAYVKVED